MPKKKLLDIFNATVYRDEKKVFDKLSLSIKCWESAVIIGPNGAGKSSLLKLLSKNFNLYSKSLFSEINNPFFSKNEIALLEPHFKSSGLISSTFIE